MKKTASAIILLLISSSAVAETSRYCTDGYFNRLAGQVGRAEAKCEKARNRIGGVEERRDEALRKIDLKISEWIVKGNPNSISCKLKGLFNNKCDSRKREQILHIRRESLVKKYEKMIARAQEQANKTCAKIQAAEDKLNQARSACSSAGSVPTPTPNPNNGGSDQSSSSDPVVSNPTISDPVISDPVLPDPVISDPVIEITDPVDPIGDSATF